MYQSIIACPHIHFFVFEDIKMKTRKNVYSAGVLLLQVRSFGGRCVRLGGERRLAVCQSGMYLDVQNEECQNLLRERDSVRRTRSEDNEDPSERRPGL